MKTIIILLTTAMLAVGATSAMAAEQGSDEAPGNALSWHVAGGFGGAQASARNVRGGRDFGAYASARETRQMRNRAFNVPAMHDFQLDGR